MRSPHHHVARTALAALVTQAFGCLASLHTSARAAEAFAALGAAAAIAVALIDTAPAAALGRRLCGSALVTLWSLRLSIFLHARNRPPAVALHVLAVSRTLWSAGAALPAVLLLAAVNAPDNFTPVEISYATIAAAALLLETRADAEKWRWHCKPDGGPVVTKGSWAFSRHANYAGEASFHCAVWALCARGAAYPALSGLSCLFMVWHMLFSNAGPLVVSERTRAVVLAKDASYASYVADTSAVVPMPSVVWRRIGPVGRTLLFERLDWRRGAFLPLLATATVRV